MFNTKDFYPFLDKYLNCITCEMFTTIVIIVAQSNPEMFMCVWSTRYQSCTSIFIFMRQTSWYIPAMRWTNWVHMLCWSLRVFNKFIGDVSFFYEINEQVMKTLVYTSPATACLVTPFSTKYSDFANPIIVIVFIRVFHAITWQEGASKT